jgi:hypothetical protein
LFAHLTPQELVNLDAAMLRAQQSIADEYGPDTAAPFISAAFVNPPGRALLADVATVRLEVNAVAFPRV